MYVPLLEQPVVDAQFVHVRLYIFQRNDGTLFHHVTEVSCQGEFPCLAPAQRCLYEQYLATNARPCQSCHHAGIVVALVDVTIERWLSEQSLEFVGSGIRNLSMDDRFTIANMAIEAGAKNGIFPVDQLCLDYLKEHGAKTPKIFEADKDAEYERTIEIDLATLKPTVAFPHLPENTHTVDKIKTIKIDQVVIGSCTNGRISDLRIAAKVMKGKKVADGIRCIVIPATQRIYLQAMEEGLLKQFVEAGCVVSTPTCGPCLGGYMGILAKGEKCVATTNRNFVGRMGHVESEIYLASPAVAAASAVAGKIVAP